VHRACLQVRHWFRRLPALAAPARWAQGGLEALQLHLDRSFDRRRGTETAGIIPLHQLEVDPEAAAHGTWYEAMGPAVFARILDALARDLDLDPGAWTFLDHGSGKGRVLMMASEAGFARVLGVEFSRELAEASRDNVRRFEARAGRPSRIEVHEGDAARFPDPGGRVLHFFFSPFTGPVMQAVAGRIRVAAEARPGEVLAVFYGANPQSLDLLAGTGLARRELPLARDWTRLTMYRAFVFGPEAAP
jgi:hypothetical protein